jgi:hypothetical protein
MRTTTRLLIALTCFIYASCNNDTNQNTKLSNNPKEK